MKNKRRSILKSSMCGGGMLLVPNLVTGKSTSLSPKPMTRSFGRIEHNVTTMGLGGQASLMWTPADVNPEAIIHKALDRGINYFDTSNIYGQSQTLIGKVFREHGLVAGLPGYSESKRRSIFLTSKTGLRLAKGYINGNVIGSTDGPKGSHALDDVRRTLTQVFGDGKGYYPPGSYVDMVLIHYTGYPQIDKYLYLGMDRPDPADEMIGAFAGLRDLRDGTNLTGLNPKHEKLIRYIGISGHSDPMQMMKIIQQDQYGLLDGILVPANANDKLHKNMQNNVIPVAKAKGLGVVGMKVFSDGAMYSKDAKFTEVPDEVVRSVGSKYMPSESLVKYSLTVPGVDVVIMGIGQIDNTDSRNCQLEQNLQAAQIGRNGLSQLDREEIEQMAGRIKDGKTNYFQLPQESMSAPNHLKMEQKSNQITFTWDTAFADKHIITHYDIVKNDVKIAQVKHTPQINETPFHFKDTRGQNNEVYKIVTVDAAGHTAESKEFIAKW
ncbi:aldo/keto reductase [Pontiella agarivorans]|uniref:Aldo/keto reductase n=1 Tax=Pontiella agarivorans TaxID=3038953 RepID=A0ABU5MY21_9BACT|nr:aldo/keto reductase [Pontiella agarivorans]MDZ8119109.1 aldo/keto reductase [Pontiella agarivorans]